MTNQTRSRLADWHGTARHVNIYWNAEANRLDQMAKANRQSVLAPKQIDGYSYKEK
jgi:hypothetical protein